MREESADCGRWSEKAKRETRKGTKAYGKEAQAPVAKATEIKKATKKKNSAKKPESCIEVETVVDDGYDGYYDDIHPIDEGHEREGVDKELVKKIAIIIGVLFVVIAACVALMYVL